MMETFIVRQGDILFRKTDSLNKKEEKQVGNKTVALGEITGHHHSFGAEDNVLLYRETDMISGLEVLEEQNQLTHQEHIAIQFPKGDYQVTRERSYNPFLRQMRMSLD